MHRLALVIFLLVLAGCSGPPDIYAPPVQRQPLTGSEFGRLGRFVAMNDPNVDAYIVQDISKNLESGAWRWTGRRPLLRFYIESADNLKFAAHFSIAEGTFKETGPVTISVLVNDRLLDRIYCPQPAEQHFGKPVPASFLKPDAVNLVALEPDKVWVSKTDGAVLGFILTSAGFTP